MTWRVRRGGGDLAPDERSVVLAALRHFHGVRYHLIAAVVMNDHVHVLFTLVADHPVERVLHTWKSFTAHEIQRRAGRRGGIWQDESFERLLRDEGELLQKTQYIVGNPGKRWPDLAEYPWLFQL